MPHVRDEEDEDNDAAEQDPEGPDPSEMDYSDEPDLDVCPHCRKLISEESDRCPHCGQYIIASDSPMPRGALIVIAVIALIVIAMLCWRSI
jgi:uncharacterized paraquat-inducible protein A